MARRTPVSLVVGAGKDGNIYILDRSNLGKFDPNMDSIYQMLPMFCQAALGPAPRGSMAGFTTAEWATR